MIRSFRSNKIQLNAASDFAISVVIVSFNTKEMTVACVKSIFEHCDDVRVEVIVIDNQSSDGSSQALRTETPEAKVIDSPINGGFAYGNAIGMEQARGKFVLLLNPDTLIGEGCLKACIDFLDENPMVGIMGPKVLLENGTQQSSMIRFLGLRQLAFLALLPSHWVRQSAWLGDPRYARLSPEEPHLIDAISGCFMIIRREVIEQVGGLDTRFFMFGEEIEWCHRVRRAGWEIAYNPSAQIMHYGSASTKHIPSWKAVAIARGHVLFLRFTRGSTVARLGTGLMIARDLLRAPYHLTRAMISGLRLTPAGRAWWDRLRFECNAICRLPNGQQVNLPDPKSFDK